MRTFVRTQLWPAIAILLAFTVITGLIYPAIVTAAAQVVFPSQANGSMITANGQTVNIGALITKSWHPASIIYISYVSLAVLAAAHEEDVDEALGKAGAQRELVHLHRYAAPLAPLDQGHDVAAVSVYVHQVRVEPPDAHRQLSSQ